MGAPLLPQIGPDLGQWGRQLTNFLQRNLTKLFFKTSTDNPSENGILLWDDVNQYPVISKNGEWRQVVLEDGNYSGGIASNVTAAAANTAYALTYTAIVAEGITNGTPASRLVFAESGEYMISFSAQIISTSSSSVTFWFWPRINNIDITGSTMKNSLHNNGSTFVTSRSAIFNITAGDYLEAMWAVDNTSGYLTAAAATAFAPSAPASTISITRLHG